MKELLIPPAAERDAGSLEILRAWIAEKGLHCSLKIGIYDGSGIAEEKAWGIILADAAKHVADALSSERGQDKDAVLWEIRVAFESELDKPTSEVHGAFRN